MSANNTSNIAMLSTPTITTHSNDKAPANSKAADADRNELSCIVEGEDGTMIEMPCSRAQFEENLSNALLLNGGKQYKTVKSRVILNAMEQVTMTYTSNNDQKAHNLFNEYEKDGIIFPCKWNTFLLRLRNARNGLNNLYSVVHGKFMQNGKELLAVVGYYSSTMKLVKEKYGGKLNSESNPRICAVVKSLSEKYSLNASLLKDCLIEPTQSALLAVLRLTDKVDCHRCTNACLRKSGVHTVNSIAGILESAQKTQLDMFESMVTGHQNMFGSMMISHKNMAIGQRDAFSTMAITNHDAMTVQKDVFGNVVILDKDIAISQKNAFNNMITMQNDMTIRHENMYATMTTTNDGMMIRQKDAFENMTSTYDDAMTRHESVFRNVTAMHKDVFETMTATFKDNFEKLTMLASMFGGGIPSRHLHSPAFNSQ